MSVAEHDWRELLDDPEVPAIVSRVLNGTGRRTYNPAGQDALIFDDLECFLYDRAVDFAVEYVGPGGTHFHAALGGTLKTSVPWLRKQFIGEPGSVKRAAWNVGIRSVEAITAARAEDGTATLEAMVDHGDAYWYHRITASDPLGVILRREHLEAMLRQAEYRARHGAYVTETHPDVLCREPMCRSLVLRAGYCNAHYKRQFAQWGRADGTTPPCADAACNLLAVTRGFCERHYQAEHKRRQREADPWPEVETGPCAVSGCERDAETKGFCALHYAQARESSAPPCSEPDCDRPAFAKGLCRRDYKRQARANGKPCTIPGCDRAAESRGMCNTHYERERTSRR